MVFSVISVPKQSLSWSITSFDRFSVKNNLFWFHAQQFGVKCSWCGRYYELDIIAFNEIGFFENINGQHVCRMHCHGHWTLCKYPLCTSSCLLRICSNNFGQILLWTWSERTRKKAHQILWINVNKHIFPKMQ